MRYKTIRVGEFGSVLGRIRNSAMGVDIHPCIVGAVPRRWRLIPQVFEKRSNGLKYCGWRWSTGINLVRSFLSLRLDIDDSAMQYVNEMTKLGLLFLDNSAVSLKALSGLHLKFLSSWSVLGLAMDRLRPYRK